MAANEIRFVDRLGLATNGVSSLTDKVFLLSLSVVIQSKITAMAA
jgi:hypothetical protein